MIQTQGKQQEMVRNLFSTQHITTQKYVIQFGEYMVGRTYDIWETNKISITVLVETISPNLKMKLDKIRTPKSHILEMKIPGRYPINERF